MYKICRAYLRPRDELLVVGAEHDLVPLGCKVQQAVQDPIILQPLNEPSSWQLRRPGPWDASVIAYTIL